MPNVKLIDPWISISELIKNSKAVTVITSTTGLESILWNKPVIVFGEVFYNIYPFVHKINNITKLPELIKSAIGEKIEENCPERLAFIYLYSRMGYTSDIYSHQLTDQKIVDFATELLIEISKQ